MTTRKEPAISAGGMAVTAHPLASAAAIEVMAAGGNAIDAAVAAGVAITVVEPMMSTIFGNSYLLIRLASGEVTALDSYGCAPKAAHADMWEFEPNGNSSESTRRNFRSEGYQSPLVGGALKGMETAHRRYGRLPWADVLAPAIRLAEGGFRVSQFFADAVSMYLPKIRRFPATAAQFLADGQPRPVGSRLIRGDYAQTLKVIARKGADALYCGEIGQVVADDMARNGGLITLEDLAAYRVLERVPLTGSYRGHGLTVMPPSSSGGTHVIQMLNILEGYDIGGFGFGSPEAVHLLLEAARIAFADRGRYMGDPEVTTLPIGWLISKAYAAERRAGIDLGLALPQEPGIAPGWALGAGVGSDDDSAHTTHLTVVDGEGNIVTTTQTANGLWGSGVTIPGTGMVLNNGMITLDPRSGRTNSLAAGKRGLSTTCPTILLREGRPWLALGTPGGNRIIPAIVQAISNVVDHGMTIQEAVEAPRCFAGTEREVDLELEFAPKTFQAIGDRGHAVLERIRVAGGMQAVMISDDGTLTGASCWRSDGAPVGMSEGPAAQGR